MAVITTIQKGISHRTATPPTVSVTAQPPGVTRFSLVMPATTSRHLESLEHGPDVEDGDHEHDDRQHERDARSIAELEADEGVPVHGDGERLRRAIGSALRHHPDDVEDLEAVDEVDPHDDHRHRSQQRKRDMAKELPAIRTVHLAG